MKAKEKEVKKTLSRAELEGELHQAQEKLFRLQFKHQVTPLANPLELRGLRRHVARLKTWVREKQAAGVARETK
jgi:large subunit ribosomal protein L29